MVNLSLFDEYEQQTEEKPIDELSEEISLMNVAVKRAELRGVDLEANGRLTAARKIEFGQFMTPANVAQFMASLFSGRKSKFGYWMLEQALDRSSMPLSSVGAARV